jgi:hypothetical protein
MSNFITTIDNNTVTVYDALHLVGLRFIRGVPGQFHSARVVVSWPLTVAQRTAADAAYIDLAAQARKIEQYCIEAWPIEFSN